MTKERELLRECYFYIDNKIDVSPKALLIRIEELLSQPEPEPVVWQIVKKVGHKPPLVDYLYSKPREQVYENYKVTELCKRMG